VSFVDRLSFQLYSARKFPPIERQLATLAGLGYQKVEPFAGLYDEADTLKSALDKNGMAAPSSHIGIDMMRADFDGAVAIAKRFGVGIVVLPYLQAPERPKDSTGWTAFGKELQGYATKLKQKGLRLAWHNHDFEMQALGDGKVPMDLILAAAPDLLWEADIGWIVRAGADPLPWLQRYRDRVKVVHLKDVAPSGGNQDEDGWADVGQGSIDWKRLVPALASAELLIVEHDNPTISNASPASRGRRSRAGECDGDTGTGVGIVGCGNISASITNAPRFRGVKIRAGDLRPEAAAAQAKLYGVEAFRSTRLARDDINIVVNLTVPNAHSAVSSPRWRPASTCFRRNLAVALDLGRQVVAEADRRGLRIGCAPDTFWGRQPAARRLDRPGRHRPAADRHRLHPVARNGALASGPGIFFAGGGPVLDMGPYYITTLVNLLGPVKHVVAMTSSGFAERVVTSDSPQKGKRIAVETPTTALALLEFANGAQVIFGASWDVWKHSLPAIEIHGTEGSLRVPDPNFFGGEVELSARGGDWAKHDTAAMPLGAVNWPAASPRFANYRAFGVAELAAAISEGRDHRASGRLALHVLEVMESILVSGKNRAPVEIASIVQQPAELSDTEAAALLA
jgi:predicted dehydrogenase/sugar phosphate isomerase/epimerase